MVLTTPRDWLPPFPTARTWLVSAGDASLIGLPEKPAWLVEVYEDHGDDGHVEYGLMAVRIIAYNDLGRLGDPQTGRRLTAIDWERAPGSPYRNE